jgi:hypothetical protein
MCSVLLACSAETRSDRSVPGEESVADGPTAGPAPTATAEPTLAGQPVLRTSIQSSCRLTALGAEVRVEYSVSAFGATMIQRVRLLQDGREVADSGPLERRQFRDTAVLEVEPGETHTYRISAEAPGAASPNVQSTVRCGVTATPTRGPRA